MPKHAVAIAVGAALAAWGVGAGAPATADWHRAGPTWTNSGSNSQAPQCYGVVSGDAGLEDGVAVTAFIDLGKCLDVEHTRSHWAEAERQTTGVWNLWCDDPTHDEPGNGDLESSGEVEFGGMHRWTCHNWAGWMLQTWMAGESGGCAEGNEYEDVEEEEDTEDWASSASNDVYSDDDAMFWSYVSCHVSGGPNGAAGAAEITIENGAQDLNCYVEPPPD